MTRRAFLRNAAIVSAAPKALAASLTRAGLPIAVHEGTACSLLRAYPKANFDVTSYDFMGGPAACEAFRKMWEENMKRYYEGVTEFAKQ